MSRVIVQHADHAQHDLWQSRKLQHQEQKSPGYSWECSRKIEQSQYCTRLCLRQCHVACSINVDDAVDQLPRHDKLSLLQKGPLWQ
eukprot:11161793-Karenia_brevis.AAC.1